MDVKDFRTYKAPDLTFEFGSLPVKLWLIEPSMVTTDRQITADSWLEDLDSFGSNSAAFRVIFLELATFMAQNAASQKSWEIIYETALEAQSIINLSLYHKERVSNFLRVASLYCVTENEPLNHPDSVYTEHITNIKLNYTQLPEVYAFFLNVALVLNSKLIATWEKKAVSLDTMIKAETNFRRKLLPKIEMLRKKGILSSKSYL